MLEMSTLLRYIEERLLAVVWNAPSVDCVRSYPFISILLVYS
jgi:hypothetical protein